MERTPRLGRLDRWVFAVALCAGSQWCHPPADAAEIRRSSPAPAWRDDAGPPATGERSRHADPFLPGVEPSWTPSVQHWWRLDARSQFGVGFEPTVNRVDGLSLMARQAVRVPHRSWAPNLTAYEGYGLASERWSGSIETWLHPGPRSWSIGARWADETVAHLLPTQPLNAAEHFIAAGLLREDLLDYLRRDGATYLIEWSRVANEGLQLAWFDDRHRSLEREVARYGPFGGKKRFRANPPVEDGRFGGLRVRGRWAHEDMRLSGPSPMASIAVDAQWVQEVPEGRGRFTRIWVEHRAEVRLTPAQGLAYRVAAGCTPRGVPDVEDSRLPRQWQFRAGGIGSLRGHRDAEFRGDRLVLGTVEYVLHPSAELRPVLFLDGGLAWNTRDDRRGGMFGSGPLAVDGGLGLWLGERGPRIDIARDLRRDRASARVTVRLSTPY